MSNLLLYIIFIAIYFVALFFGYKLGANVLLFNVVVLLFLIIVLFKKKRITNKWGLLFGIPIIMLSISYLLYANIFQLFNFIVLPILFTLLLVYSMSPSYSLVGIIEKVVRVIFEPFGFIGRFYTVVSSSFSKLLKIDKAKKKKIISYIIIIPIVVIILLLLISADTEFKNLFSGISNLFKDFNLVHLIFRIISFIIFFTWFGAVCNYLLFGFKKFEDSEARLRVDSDTMKRLLIILNIIYVVFDIIQIRSLLLHHVGDGIIYSEYARSGFFQLMVISVINISILLITKHCKEDIIHKHMSLLMVLLTFIIICSSIYRMYMYDMAYGYTVLRLLVYITLVTELLLLIPTIIYIYKDKFKILKYYLIIIISIYSIVNMVSIDRVIAETNIERYNNTGKLDIDYLENYQFDNTDILYNLYKNTDDKEIKESLEDYFYVFRSSYRDKKKSIIDYNVSRDRGQKIFDKFDKES